MNIERVQADKEAFVSALHAWYLKYHRKLPWRTQPSLYRTVVSEFMLQQTQVDTVLPYFDRWMQTFPDFEVLAAAQEESVVKAWEGLGYYSRARNLHKLSKALVQLDSIPSTPEEWQALPGVGPYTSAAITSIALKYPVAVIDGNLIRILTRIFADGTLFKDNSTAMKHLGPYAQGLLSEESPGMHNEAMMELGATICFKQKPLCTVCPVQRFCKASALGAPEQYPKLQRKKTQQVTIHRAWIVRNKRLLLYKNPGNARRLANFYEYPSLEGLNLDLPDTQPIFSKTRGISNQRISEHFHKTKLSRAKLPPEYSWVPLDELEDITLSGPHRKWLSALLAI